MSVADDRNALARERRAATCRHFTGTANDRCKIGIAYPDVEDEQRRLPCLPPFGDRGPCTTTCEKRSLPTAEEIDEQDRERAASLRRIFSARKAITDATGGKRGCQGVIDCPNCTGGKLRYTVAGNGHVWGACSTEGCARWME